MTFEDTMILTEPHIAAAMDQCPVAEVREQDGVTWMDAKDAARVLLVVVKADRVHRSSFIGKEG